jgi:hypothetical protein
VTPLRKPIRRWTTLELRRGQLSTVLVTLHPEGILEFRLKARRSRYQVDLVSAYWLAARKAAEERMQQRKTRVPRRSTIKGSP